MSHKLPWILGIASSHNGGACLLHGAELIVAVQEERLLRQKRAEHPGAFPSLSVSYCLDYAGITAAKLDAVSLCAAQPTKNSRHEDIYLNPQLRVVQNGIRVFVIPHHFGHAAAVHALSGMQSSAVLIVDGSGSPWDELLEDERAVIIAGQLEACNQPNRTIPRESVSLYLACEGCITPIEKHIASYPADQSQEGMPEFQSLGDMYGAVGSQIFGSFLDGAGKVMGLAPYGRPTIPVEEFFRTRGPGFEFQDAVRKRFAHHERWPAHAEEYKDLAASVQRALETAVLSLCRRLREMDEKLAYAGGVALNSVANERIVRDVGFQDVFIMPAAEDCGTAVGAAHYALWQLCGYSRGERQRADSFGRCYTECDISSAIQRMPGLLASKSHEFIEETAELLSKGRIVGWFQAGSELGPRALGHRSILCDPRSPEMKDLLNQRVKFREAFRPFAPIILEEDVYDWFAVMPPLGDSPFMLRVLPFRPEQALRVPAVVHVDGTGRVQTVSKESSPLLYRLLTAFKRKTGIPILLNTSFNIAGEPIVETPMDALWCLLYTEMDQCVLGDYLVHKASAGDKVLDFPLWLGAASLLTYSGLSKTSLDFSVASLHETNGHFVSGHLSRIEDLGVATQILKWLRLLIVVNTPWGEAIHGLPNGLLRILRLVDGQRTGRQIYIEIQEEVACELGSAGSNENSSLSPYTLSQFRKHIGLLARIGAIRFAPPTQVSNPLLR